MTTILAPNTSPAGLKNYLASAKSARAAKLVLIAGTGAAGFAAHQANATVHYSGTLNITTSNADNGLYVRMSDFAVDHVAANVTGWNFDPYFEATTPFGPSIYLTGATGSPGFVSTALTFGAEVDTQTFDSANPLTGIATDNTPKYFGLSFNPGSGTVYGWMQISFAPTTNFVTLIDAAYNDVPGGAITAGQTIPEPANAALLLGAGAAGMILLRRRQKNLRPVA
jgi:hypothetical protein